MNPPEPYAVYAVKYAHMERTAADNFVGGDPHDGPMPLDYFVWAAVGPTRTLVVDTGFSAEEARRRGRDHLRCPTEGLAALGIDAGAVTDVVITHLHYDHAGNLDRFPRARFHIQDREMSYATGRFMAHPFLRHAFSPDHVVTIVRYLYQDRVVFHDGEGEVAPGITVHRVGGHTHGLQVVRIWTAGGWLVLASDASHFYANMREGRPFPIVLHVGDMLEAYTTLSRLAASPAHIVPGHDPEVMERYPAVAGLEGVAVRLDRARVSNPAGGAV